MKKLISILVMICLVLCLCGCGGTPVDSQKVYYGYFTPIEGEKNLYYDHTTKIVYFFSSNAGGYSYMSPYYADNGFPYIYNVESNTLEKIN